MRNDRAEAIGRWSPSSSRGRKTIAVVPLCCEHAGTMMQTPRDVHISRSDTRKEARVEEEVQLGRPQDSDEQTVLRPPILIYCHIGGRKPRLYTVEGKFTTATNLRRIDYLGGFHPPVHSTPVLRIDYSFQGGRRHSISIAL